MLMEMANRYYAAGDGNRKPDHYIGAYERIFGGVRNSPLSLLEIGVCEGHSSLMWLDYFPHASIVGLDISECPDKLIGNARYKHVQGSQDDTALLEQAGHAGGPFNIIMDDASHIGWLTQASMFYLFPRWLKPGGHYVIEDYGTGLRPEFPDSDPNFRIVPPERNAKRFQCHDHGLTGFIKQPIDHMMMRSRFNDPDALPIEDIYMMPSIAFIKKRVIAEH